MTFARPFAGWWVVAGAFLCMMTGYAVAYSFAAFFGALETEFGARRGETSLVFSIAAFLYFQLGFPAGLIADRTGPRPLVVGGLLLVALGLAVASQATALWQIYLGYGLGVDLLEHHRGDDQDQVADHAGQDVEKRKQ